MAGIAPAAATGTSTAANTATTTATFSSTTSSSRAVRSTEWTGQDILNVDIGWLPLQAFQFVHRLRTEAANQLGYETPAFLPPDRGYDIMQQATQTGKFIRDALLSESSFSSSASSSSSSSSSSLLPTRSAFSYTQAQARRRNVENALLSIVQLLNMCQDHMASPLAYVTHQSLQLESRIDQLIQRRDLLLRKAAYMQAEINIYNCQLQWNQKPP